MHQSPLVKDLHAVLGGENVISAPSELAAYDCDAFTLDAQSAGGGCFPSIDRANSRGGEICNRHGMAIVPRGAGLVWPADVCPSDAASL